MNQTMWLVRRAGLAIALMIGFYVFALAIALTLVWIPYAEWVYIGRVHIKIAAVCIGAALTVLWALVPRADRFEAPGPRLDEVGQPRLFELIHQTAASANQAMPTDVYLLNEVNAWVTHRGGMMGFRSRRVMGLGLPLLQVLSVQELRAVIAHEFGHYASGDVKLGPWIYKTRAAIGRTIAGVHQTFIEAPFLWYGRLFLKLTHAVARRQEFIADQIAARSAGAAALTSALRRLAGLTQAFDGYVRGELLPVLRAGFLPPIVAGFTQYLDDENVAASSEEMARTTESNGETDPYDTHPSLRDRIAALNGAPEIGSSHLDERPAIVLLVDAERQARALAEFAFGDGAVAQLTSIDWTQVGERVYAAAWRDVAKSHADFLRVLIADKVSVGSQAFIRLGSDLVGPNEQNINGEERVARASYVIAVGVAVLLLDSGWRAETALGRPVLLARGGQMFEPFGAIRGLASGKTSANDWSSQCAALGIAGRALSAT